MELRSEEVLRSTAGPSMSMAARVGGGLFAAMLTGLPGWQEAKTTVRLRDPAGQAPDRSTRVALFHFAPTRDEGPGGGRSLIFSAALPRVLAEKLRPQLAADGTLVLDGLPRHTSCGLEIQAPGLGRQRVYYLSPEAGDKQVLQLGRVVSRPNAASS